MAYQNLSESWFPYLRIRGLDGKSPSSWVHDTSSGLSYPDSSLYFFYAALLFPCRSNWGSVLLNHCNCQSIRASYFLKHPDPFSKLWCLDSDMCVLTRIAFLCSPSGETHFLFSDYLFSVPLCLYKLHFTSSFGFFWLDSLNLSLCLCFLPWEFAQLPLGVFPPHPRLIASALCRGLLLLFRARKEKEARCWVIKLPTAVITRTLCLSYSSFMTGPWWWLQSWEVAWDTLPTSLHFISIVWFLNHFLSVYRTMEFCVWYSPLHCMFHQDIFFHSYFISVFNPSVTFSQRPGFGTWLFSSCLLGKSLGVCEPVSFLVKCRW